MAHQTRALAIHQQLGGFDTPDAAVAHYVLGTALHKVNKQKTKQNKEREREKRKKRKKNYDMNQVSEIKESVEDHMIIRLFFYPFPPAPASFPPL